MDVRSRAGALALCMAALVMTLQAHAAKPLLKETLETSVRQISMPDYAGGMMTVTTACRSCPAKIFRSTAGTVYKLRDVPVSFAVFRQALVTSPDTYVEVQFIQSTKDLVTVTANLDPPVAGKR